MIHSGTKEIRTNRLYLRQFNIKDAHSMYNNWASNKNVSKYLSWNAHKDIRETESVLIQWVTNYENNKFYTWCIEYENMPIGSISVIDINEQLNACEIGYCLGENWWNKKITTEAICAVRDFLIEDIGFEMVYAGHHIDNVNSGKALLKCGFVQDDSLRNLTRFQKMNFEINTYSYKK